MGFFSLEESIALCQCTFTIQQSHHILPYSSSRTCLHTLLCPSLENQGEMCAHDRLLRVQVHSHYKLIWGPTITKTEHQVRRQLPTLQNCDHYFIFLLLMRSRTSEQPSQLSMAFTSTTARNSVEMQSNLVTFKEGMYVPRGVM